MAKILSFDSMYLVSPIRGIYLWLVKKVTIKSSQKKNLLVLYRLDRDNAFLRDRRNIAGMTLGIHRDQIDVLSLKFYNHLQKFNYKKELQFKGVSLYELHTRQVKLKLASVLRCAIRIMRFSDQSREKIKIITDKQTALIIKEALSFLSYNNHKIIWNINLYLTVCVTINALIMRFGALLKMVFSSTDLPKEYYYKHVNVNSPTVLITMPKRRPEIFFSTYIETFNDKFNIILYSMGFLKNPPHDFKTKRVKRTVGSFSGLLNIKNLFLNVNSYICDILLIYKSHSNLSLSIDVVNSIYSNEVHAHISRLQTSIVDNYLAIEARKREIFILADIFEEVYYCDSAICSSLSENTEALKLALNDSGKVTYRKSNSLIKYRLETSNNKDNKYLHKLLEIDLHSKIIFYASDPLKEESQRYLTEKFLIDCFNQVKDFFLVIKTHPQDNGKITNYSYLDSSRPSNIRLIGDGVQKRHIVSKKFMIFNEFDFNAAINSSDGFITSSSTSILQALVLGVKTAVLDVFNNGFYDYLIEYEAIMLINDEDSFKYFLENEKLSISNEVLTYCGLNNESEEFDVGVHLLKCLGDKLDMKTKGQ